MGKLTADSTLDESGVKGKSEGKSYKELLQYLNPIAKPLASRKQTKRLYRCVKKAAKQKSLRRGVNDRLHDKKLSVCHDLVN